MTGILKRGTSSSEPGKDMMVVVVQAATLAAHDDAFGARVTIGMF